jgi:hypothetical protein
MSVSVIVAAVGQGTAPGVRGIYTGTYVCNQRQFGLRLSFEPRSASQLSVVVTFFTPGTDASEPLVPSAPTGRLSRRPAGSACSRRPGSSRP